MTNITTIRSTVQGSASQLRIVARVTGTQTRRTLRVDKQRSLKQNHLTAAILVSRAEAEKLGIDPSLVKVVQHLEEPGGFVAVLEGM